MKTIADMEIRALNDAESSENRIHSDEIAPQYGFKGALVSGANVFGYMTQPLTQHFGASCLENCHFDVRFLKPAYHEDLLTLSTEELTDDSKKIHLSTKAVNQHGVLLAELQSTLHEDRSMSQTVPCISPTALETTREEISWDRILLNTAAPDYAWMPTDEDNRLRVDAQRDPADIYRGLSAFIHPYYLLDSCNQALKRMFILPAWIHTSSQLAIRHRLRVGQTITVRAVPIEKWERNGHQFVRLSISMIVGEEVAAEVLHTAIFKIAS
jgi:acyl dehydratase